jgi:hypothetical protein
MQAIIPRHGGVIGQTKICFPAGRSLSYQLPQPLFIVLYLVHYPQGPIIAPSYHSYSYLGTSLSDHQNHTIHSSGLELLIHRSRSYRPSASSTHFTSSFIFHPRRQIRFVRSDFKLHIHDVIPGGCYIRLLRNVHGDILEFFVIRITIGVARASATAGELFTVVLPKCTYPPLWQRKARDADGIAILHSHRSSGSLRSGVFLVSAQSPSSP